MTKKKAPSKGTRQHNGGVSSHRYLRRQYQNELVDDNDEGDAIFEDTSLFGRGMNVTKLGPTCITLYDYNMLGKKTVGKINYKDVTILNETKDIPGFEGTLEALDSITIKGGQF